LNDSLCRLLGLDDVRVCWHDDGDRCACRKPRPGLLFAAAADLGLDLSRSFMIGDRWRDVGAGRRAGCRTVLVDQLEEGRELEPDHRSASLLDAVGWILSGAVDAHASEGRTIDLSALRVRLYSDSGDLDELRAAAADPHIAGFTTNPTLMRKAGVSDYEEFAREALLVVGRRPISFEVFADDLAEMREQAIEIASWGPNVDVKIPIVDSKGAPSDGLLRQLVSAGVNLNVTAVMTLEQVSRASAALEGASRAIVSVFAGRYADTGRDPVPMMREAAAIAHAHAGIELLWASPREFLNVLHAEQAGCDIITISSDLRAKLRLVGKDLDEYSLETVRMFHDDAIRAGYRLQVRDGGRREPETAG
jgi:transaldolase